MTVRTTKRRITELVIGVIAVAVLVIWWLAHHETANAVGSALLGAGWLTYLAFSWFRPRRP